MPVPYDAHAVEARRQAAWRERAAFATPPLAEDQPHLYIKPSAPFTSGNVHIGHVRSYSIGDAYARFRRARGTVSCSRSALTPSACRRSSARSQAASRRASGSGDAPRT